MTDRPEKPRGVREARPASFEAAPPAKGATLKVRRIGNSLGVVLPKEVLARLRVGEGDQLIVTETPGGVRLAASEDGDAALMALAEGIMRKRRKVLKALAE